MLRNQIIFLIRQADLIKDPVKSRLVYNEAISLCATNGEPLRKQEFANLQFNYSVVHHQIADNYFKKCKYELAYIYMSQAITALNTTMTFYSEEDEDKLFYKAVSAEYVLGRAYTSIGIAEDHVEQHELSLAVDMIEQGLVDAKSARKDFNDVLNIIEGSLSSQNKNKQKRIIKQLDQTNECITKLTKKLTEIKPVALEQQLSNDRHQAHAIGFFYLQPTAATHTEHRPINLSAFQSMEYDRFLK